MSLNVACISSAIRTGRDEPRSVMGNNHGSSARRMLKVTIEDAVAADQLFATLMGD